MPKATVEGVQRVINALRQHVRDVASDGNVSVFVGFGQSYALYVHEDLEARHKVGQAKFLETAARTTMPEVWKAIGSGGLRSVPFARALYIGGLRIQRAAQELCPVDTGALRASGFTAYEDELEDQFTQAAQEGAERRHEITRKRKKAATERALKMLDQRALKKRRAWEKREEKRLRKLGRIGKRRR